MLTLFPHLRFALTINILFITVRVLQNTAIFRKQDRWRVLVFQLKTEAKGLKGTFFSASGSAFEQPGAGLRT